MATHRWEDIERKKFTPEQIKKIDGRVKAELLTMELRELREEAGRTQVDVAQAAEMAQAELSRFERRDDHLISTLRRYIGALGGELEVVAVMGNKRITLKGV